MKDEKNKDMREDKRQKMIDKIRILKEKKNNKIKEMEKNQGSQKENWKKQEIWKKKKKYSRRQKKRMGFEKKKK